MEEDFVISKLSWHTQRRGNEGYEQEGKDYFFSLAKFFQDEGLLKRQIVTTMEALSDCDEIRRSDLTEEGWLLMRQGYPKWGKKIERGMQPSDTSVLSRELKKIRQQTK